MAEFARSIEIKKGSPVKINGEEFPYFIAAEDIEAEYLHETGLAVVYLPILTDRLLFNYPQDGDIDG